MAPVVILVSRPGDFTATTVIWLEATFHEYRHAYTASEVVSFKTGPAILNLDRLDTAYRFAWYYSVITRSFPSSIENSKMEKYDLSWYSKGLKRHFDSSAQLMFAALVTFSRYGICQGNDDEFHELVRLRRVISESTDRLIKSLMRSTRRRRSVQPSLAAGQPRQKLSALASSQDALGGMMNTLIPRTSSCHPNFVALALHENGGCHHLSSALHRLIPVSNYIPCTLDNWSSDNIIFGR
ncbi:hypothetical protein SODALDRAFT_319350 [Sodiomyces alkalinus F11]|uniref:Uncharacterized protein n=1 Tax=Sodiomyces alkalinus (strain CBS 110278 / VKM F-3762 / F11) TaxID=1314773 RepID=A0A3N2Q7K0_SODAK|nr:hypothetical protein SODALDRAFT_319350 [Sodiomyces alkalinus F11]ROT42740.1 hypothetical protein SODALDRAFT_319350 [Sodiomyces alkalinus F11]